MRPPTSDPSTRARRELSLPRGGDGRPVVAAVLSASQNFAPNSAGSSSLDFNVGDLAGEEAEHRPGRLPGARIRSRSRSGGFDTYDQSAPQHGEDRLDLLEPRLVMNAEQPFDVFGRNAEATRELRLVDTCTLRRPE